MEKIKKFENKRKGITLIALIITILVLLILAGITINLTIGEYGMLNMAHQTAQNHIETEIAEQEELGKVDNKINEYISATRESYSKITISEMRGDISRRSGRKSLFYSR